MEGDDTIDFLCNESLDDSFCDSEPDIDDNPVSVNVDLTNGWPYSHDNFLVLHYNINSITAEGRLEELIDLISNLNVDILVCTESKLCDTIPNNIISIPGFHEPVRHDRNRSGGGCMMYISNKLSFKHKTDLQSEKYEHI